MNPCDQCPYPECLDCYCVQRLRVVVQELSEQLAEHEKTNAEDAHGQLAETAEDRARTLHEMEEEQ